MKRTRSAYKIIEIVWLIIAGMSFIAFIHALLRGGLYKDSIMFAIICSLSVLMYVFRKQQRKQKNTE